MKKDINDFLHLYLMCKYQWKDSDGEWRRAEILTAYQLNSIRQSGREVRLILRPLSDATEQEEKEWAELDGIICTIKDRAKEVQYLLSKGFDLFNLIPEGLAIDATTLKKEA